MSSPDLGRLIELMYRCVDDPAQVNEFLAAVCAATRCHNGSVHVQDLKRGTGSIPALLGNGSVSAEAMATYEHRYAAENVLMQRAAPLAREGWVLYSYDLITLRELRATRYWREFMREMDVDHCVGICGLMDRDNIVALSLNFSDKRGHFDTAECALVEALSPHWVNVCRLQRKFGLLQLEAGTLRATLDGIGTAVLFLDAGGHVCGSNAAADQMLAQAELFQLRHARLVPRWHADAAALQKAIDTTIAAGMCGEAASSRRLALHDAHGTPAAVADVQMLPLGSATAHSRACAVLFVRDIGAVPGSAFAPLLETVYKLTPAEARLAAAFAIGGDADRAGIECGLTHETTRSRFKQIFAKIGVHSQSELMQLLMRWGAAAGTTK